MKFFNLSSLQQQPLAVRMRILWGVTAAIAVILFLVWIYSTSQSVKKAEKTEIPGINTQQTPAESVNAETQRINIEWIEHKEKTLLVYFKVNNTTNNILNFSKLEDITLAFNDQNYKAKYIQDRQGSQFVVKVLSNTQKFGMVAFDDVQESSAEIKFDNLFFENEEQNVFYETTKLDLKALNKPIEIRQ